MKNNLPRKILLLLIFFTISLSFSLIGNGQFSLTAAKKVDLKAILIAPYNPGVRGPRRWFDEPVVRFEKDFVVEYNGEALILCGNSKGTFITWVDDILKMTITHSDGTTSEFTIDYLRIFGIGVPWRLPPKDISRFFKPGKNHVNVKLLDWGYDYGWGEIWLVKKKEIAIVEMGFQPVQVVWQNDPDYPDSMRGSGRYWNATLPMVAGKSTLLFGYPNPERIVIRVRNYYTSPRNVSIRITAHGLDRKVEIYRTEWVLPPAFPGNLNNPYDQYTPNETNITIRAPIPDDPFRLEPAQIIGLRPGLYRFELEILDAEIPPWEEDDPNNNVGIVISEFVRTHPLRILIKPLVFPESSHVVHLLGEGFLNNTAFQTVQELVDEARAFISGTYPVAERDFVVVGPRNDRDYLTTSYAFTGMTPEGVLFGYFGKVINEAQWRGMGNISRNDFRVNLIRGIVASGWAMGYDRVVLLTEPGLLSIDGAVGMAYPYPHLKSVVFAEWNGSGDVIAHELAHTYGLTAWRVPIGGTLRTFKEEYDPHVPNNNNGRGRTARGYWVTQGIWRDIRFFRPPAIRNYYCFMGKAVPMGVDAKWIDKECYERLLYRFMNFRDPEVLGVRGLIYRNGTVILDPWYRFKDGVEDISPSGSGNYLLVFYDSTGKIIDRIYFNITFGVYMEPLGLVETDSVPFAFRVPYDPDTRIIKFQDSEGNVLASRVVSPNSPSVEILYPSGGETLLIPGNYTITWRGLDPDNDRLTYLIIISDDGGETWHPLNFVELRKENYTFNAYNLGVGENFLIKVIATDGVNVGQDVLEEPFSIKYLTKLTIEAPEETIINEECSINVTLSDGFGRPIENATLRLFVNGAFVISKTTDSNGRVTFSYSPKKIGELQIVAEFIETSEYASSRTTLSLKVKEKPADYTIYLIIIGVLIAAVIIVFYARRKKQKE